MLKKSFPALGFWAAISCIMGTVAFLVIVGPRVLDPENISWLSVGDPAQHFLGWHFFRNSEWSFPAGLNPAFGLEIGSAITFSDSIPLLAFLFKPFSSLLPEVFQYSGFWLYACFVLQAWFGWKLAGLVFEAPLLRIFASGLFVFSPPMIWRLYGHLSLVAHFLVIAALYLALRPDQDRRSLRWGGVLVIAALVHAYLLAMVAVIWLASLLDEFIKHKERVKYYIGEFVCLMLLIFLACWQAGYFSVGGGISSDGYGVYKMNLLSLFDASRWSYVLQDIPEAVGEYEGFNFLGLGIIVLLLFSLPSIFAGRVDVLSIAGRWPVLLLVLVCLAFYALSNKVGIGPVQFGFSLPEQFMRFANVFRASGRMFWPVFYVLILFALYSISRAYGSRMAGSLLVVSLLIQVVDTSAAWRGIRKTFMTEPAKAWPTPLKDPFWTEAASRYQKVRWIMPANQSPHWQIFAEYAGRHALATDAVYLARVGAVEVGTARSQAARELESGRYRGDSLYILDAQSVRSAVSRVNFKSDLLAHVDGFYVLAPGWKECIECKTVKEVTVSDLFRPVELGQRLVFADASSSGVDYLAGGWSQPEQGGTWSGAEIATIIIPQVGSDAKSILIEAAPLLFGKHSRQRVEVRVNGELASALDLQTPGLSTLEVPIPISVSSQLKDFGSLRVEFFFPDAVRPKDIGLNADARLLALLLTALTVR